MTTQAPIPESANPRADTASFNLAALTAGDAARVQDQQKSEFLSRFEQNLKASAEGREHEIAPKAKPVLLKAIKAHRKHDHVTALRLALKACDIDPKSGTAAHICALALDALGQTAKAIQMFEHAIALDPADPDIYSNLGLTAWRLQMFEAAEKMFRLYIQMRPDMPNGPNNLAGVLRDQGRFDEAIEVAREAIYTFPTSAELWNSMGTIVIEQGLIEEATTFYREALRLDPDFARAYNNLAYTLNHTGPLEESLELYDTALRLTAPGSHDLLEMRHGRGICLLGLGRLEDGWADWETRIDPRFRASCLFALQSPQWTGEPLAGKRILVVAEQGVGDEIMFANALSELAEEVGEEGQLLISVDPRLVKLFGRSFPTAKVGPYVTRMNNGKLLRQVPWNSYFGKVDYWSVMGNTLKFRRRNIDDFPAGKTLMQPDEARVEHWRGRLAELGPGPYVGVCWRSLSMSAKRQKYFSPVDLWGEALKDKPATFVNLQYGDCAEDLAEMEKRHGVRLHHFEDLDLKDDLDDNAALCQALDMAASAPTAAAALAGAVGTETWFVTIGRVWPMLGTEGWPWYAKTRVFRPETYGDWPAVMAQLGQALDQFGAAHRAADAA